MVKRENTVFYRKDLRKKIQKTAIQCFREKGVKAVKMDDISSLLSISKRTLYEIYANKETLLFECFKVYNEEFEAHLERFDKSAKNVMQLLIEYYRMQMRTLSATNPLHILDSNLCYFIPKYRNIRKWLLIWKNFA